MRAFVTGGGGFIGRHLVHRLLASGVDVRAIARSDGSAAKLRDLGAEVVVGDVLDASALTDALRACEVVYHLAGDYRVGIRESDRPAMESANVTATERLLEEAVAAGVGRVVHVSTINAFGDTGSASSTRRTSDRGRIGTSPSTTRPSTGRTSPPTSGSTRERPC